MLLHDMCLRAQIVITFGKQPVKESVYVGEICLEKDGEEYTFDFNETTGSYEDNQLTLDLRDCDYVAAPSDATLEELACAKVKDLFLQGDDNCYVAGQTIKDISITFYDGVNGSEHNVTLETPAFADADLGEYYDLEVE